MLINSTLTRNTASGGSGAARTPADSYMQYPSAAGQGLGGALFNLDGNVTVLNSTLAGNTADQGGAIYTLGDDSTADSLTASPGPASLVLNNSILATSANSVTDFVNNTINGGTSTLGGSNNLIQTGSFAPGGASGLPLNIGGSSVEIPDAAYLDGDRGHVELHRQDHADAGQ